MDTELIGSNQLNKISDFMSMGYYDSAVKESCAILEEVLKKIYNQAMSTLPYEDRKVLMECEMSIGRGKGYNEMGFGQLVGVFRKSDLLTRWSKYTGSDLGIIRSISLDYIVELRNRLTHEGSTAGDISSAEAKLVYDCLLNWLGFIGYKEIDSGVERAFSKDRAPDREVSQPPVNQDTVYERMKQSINSGYDPTVKAESRRLVRQSKYSEALDAETFEYAVERLGGRKDLIGLDVGCASGYVTELRFKQEYGFEKVIGVDRNEKVIQELNGTDHDIFHYRHLDIESRTFDDDMEDLMDAEGVDKFDVIFCALTLHHLKNPTRFLSRIRRYLRTGGALIIRGWTTAG